MIIKLLSVHIPAFWESIKFTVKEADEVDEKDLQPYLNELLHALLNDKAQCFVHLDDERRLTAMLISRITEDRVTGDKCMLLQCLYSWQRQPDAVWQQDTDFIRQFAIKTGCKYLSFTSRNEAMFKLGEKIGFTERYRTFEHRLDERG